MPDRRPLESGIDRPAPLATRRRKERDDDDIALIDSPDELALDDDNDVEPADRRLDPLRRR